MQTLLEIAIWVGGVAGALLVAALVVAAVLEWFLEHPVEDGEGGPRSGRD
ncbi:MAG: hypothetical protein ABI699_00210 [Caldimonas sp.]